MVKLKPMKFRSRWECFPPYGDRVAHAYMTPRTFHRGGDVVREWQSRCGRRSVPCNPLDPRYSALRSTPATSPDPLDPSGCCLVCWERSFRLRKRLPEVRRWLEGPPRVRIPPDVTSIPSVHP